VTPHQSADGDHGFGRGVQAAIAAYVVWGLLTLYWKQLTDFDAFELIGWRVASASLVMAAVVTHRRRWPLIRAALTDRRLAARITIAAALLTGNWTSYVYAIVNDHVIETALGYLWHRSARCCSASWCSRSARRRRSTSPSAWPARP
jgi:chloramphenicol-sensitive protein RarD